MADCIICEWIESKKNLLFEDDKIAVLLNPEPSSPGHILVVPKKHAPILEAVPDDVVGELFWNANRGSVCAFEALGAQGTNILVQNGIPAGQKVNHVIVHVIPRFESDDIPLTWQPKQLSPEQLEQIVGQFSSESAPAEEEVEVSGDDYRVDALRRIP